MKIWINQYNGEVFPIDIDEIRHIQFVYDEERSVKPTITIYMNTFNTSLEFNDLEGATKVFTDILDVIRERDKFFDIRDKIYIETAEEMRQRYKEEYESSTFRDKLYDLNVNVTDFLCENRAIISFLICIILFISGWVIADRIFPLQQIPQ